MNDTTNTQPGDLSLLDMDLQDLQDQTVIESGGDYEPFPAGFVYIRATGYVELGKHITTYGGQAKPAAEQVRIEFEIVQTAPGKDGQRRREFVLEQMWSRSLNEKGKFRKLFDKLRALDPTAKHFYDLLWRPTKPLFWLAEIKHKQSADGKRTYANIDYSSIRIPVDPNTGQLYTSPFAEAYSPKVFIFDRATKSMWDSIFIGGDREVDGEGGTKVKVSKNVLQETIRSAINFNGSPIMLLLSGIGNAVGAPDVPSTPAPQPVPVLAAPTTVPTAQPVPQVPTAQQVQPTPQPTAPQPVPQSVPLGSGALTPEQVNMMFMQAAAGAR